MDFFKLNVFQLEALYLPSSLVLIARLVNISFALIHALHSIRALSEVNLLLQYLLYLFDLNRIFRQMCLLIEPVKRIL